MAGRTESVRRFSVTVSIPSQAGILLAGGYRIVHGGEVVSQYPLRRASSWRWTYPTSASKTSPSLNTLSGGHPLGGGDQNRSRQMAKTSQYPLRRASSWRLPAQPALHGRKVSIPSQAGILLAGQATVRRQGQLHRLNTLSGGHPLGGSFAGRQWQTASDVSIPSQAGILLAGWPSMLTHRHDVSQYPLRRASSWRAGTVPIAEPAAGLNTLSGGHPLGGNLTWLTTVTTYDRLNTLSGGHPLGGCAIP